MIKRLKCRKGVTLIELVVAMLMFTVVAAMASFILSAMLRLYINANEFAESGAMLDNIANQMTGDISAATGALDISDTSSRIIFPVSTDNLGNTHYVKYSIDSDGYLLKNEGPAEEEGGELVFAGSDYPVFHRDFYRRKTVGFICDEKLNGEGEPYAYTLTVIILSSNGAELARRPYAIRPLVMNQYL